MSLKHCLIILVLFFSACSQGLKSKSSGTPNSSGENTHLNNAIAFVKRDLLDSAFLSYKKALESGYPKPMSMVSQPVLSRIVSDSLIRPKLRELLALHAKESHCLMVTPTEPGEHIIVYGKILSARDQSPLSNVAIELSQTDTLGLYFKEKGTFNPRIFAYLKTDTAGRFSIESIMPGAYPDEQGNMVAPHIHFGLQKSGFRNYYAEFLLMALEESEQFNNIENLPIAIQKNSDRPGRKTYELIITMQESN